MKTWPLVALVVVLGLQTAVADEDCVADVCFVLDESGSIGLANWKKVRIFVNKFLDLLTIGDTDSMVGIVKFAQDSELTFGLDQYDNKPDLQSAIGSLSYISGHDTFIGKGIKTAREECFNTANGDRANGAFPNIMIVMTDGSTTDPQDAVDQAELARQEGATVIVIGIGSFTNQQNLEDIAGGISGNLFTFIDFDDFVDQVHDVFLQHCETTKVFCTANINQYDLWDFDGTPSNLGDDKVTLVEYNLGDAGCKFKVVWDRRLQPFTKRWMNIQLGVHPNDTNKYFRGINFNQKPEIIADEPTQRGWRCKAKKANPICANPPFIPSDSFLIGMPPNPPAEPFASVTKPDPGPYPLSYNVKLVDGDVWCPGDDNDPQYSMTYFFKPLVDGATMVFQIDRDFYVKHWSELSGLCVGTNPSRR